VPSLNNDLVRISQEAEATMVVARAICKLYGPRPNCICGAIRSRKCHSFELYGDFAVAAVRALQDANFMKLSADSAPSVR